MMIFRIELQSKVEHLVAFTAIFSNICTADAQKRLFMTFRCKCRHRRSIRRPRFPIRVQNFSDLATFSVDFCILYAECPPYFYFRVDWPTDLESIPHASTPTSIIPARFEVDISGGDPGGFGGSKDPGPLPEWGSRIGCDPPVLTPCWCHFFRFICWLWTETVVVDQVLLCFRPTLINSQSHSDYNVYVNVNRLNWCDHCKKSMTARYDVIQSRVLSVEV